MYSNNRMSVAEDKDPEQKITKINSFYSGQSHQ